MPRPSSNLAIYIPTRGRVDRQLTAQNFQVDDLPWPVYRVVPECEADQWNVDKLVVPNDYKFSDIRQFILQQPPAYHIVMDDDLSPALRLENDPTRFLSFKQMSQQERIDHSKKLISDIEELLDQGWIHGGVAVRQGGNRDTNRYQLNTREMRFHFYNANFVKHLGYDFRRVVIKQDLDFTLWMLEQGIPNILINYYVQDQDGSNSEGGCSRYRTDEVLTEGAYKLASLHPEFVQVVEKKPKTAWGGKSRLDVNIQWKKAYEWGLKNAETV